MLWGEISRSCTAEVEVVRGGSGREISGYAAVFDVEAEIRDQHGHYRELIDRSAFNRAIARGTSAIPLLVNHGYSFSGEPLPEYGLPYNEGPVDLRPDGRGLRVRATIRRGRIADEVLDAIRAGSMAGMSFRGPVLRSRPPRVPRIQRGGALPLIVREELGLSEVSVTASPYYSGAKVDAVRSGTWATQSYRHALPALDGLGADIARAMSYAREDPDSLADLRRAVALVTARHEDERVAELEAELGIIRARLIEIDDYDDPELTVDEIDELTERYDELDEELAELIAEYMQEA